MIAKAINFCIINSFQILVLKRSINFVHKFLLAIVFFFGTTLFAEKNVLVLHSYHHGLHWTDTISKGIITTFENSKEKINIYFEYLDSKRHIETAFMETTFRYFLIKHRNTSFDAIIVSDNDALAFVNQYQNELFANKPVIFCGINNFIPELVSNISQVTGVREVVDYKGTLSIAMELFPQRKKVMVVLDNTLTAQKILAEVKEVEKYFATKLEFYYFWDFDEVDLEKFIAHNKNELLVYALAFNRDKRDKFFSYDESIGIVKTLFGSSIPIFGSWDFFLGKGIVGGVIISGFNQGKIAAELTMRVLAHEKANSIPIQSSIGKDGLVFDYNEMERFALKVPKTDLHVSYINKPIDFFTQYKKVLIPLGILFLFLCGAMIFRELRNRERNAMLKEINASLDYKIQLAIAESEKNEKLFRFVADSSLYLIWIVDMEYKIVYINDKVKEYFNFSPQQSIGTNNFAFLSPLYREEMHQQMEKLSKDSRLDSLLFEVYCDDICKYMKNTIIPIRSSEGEVVGYKGIIQDITEEKMSLNLLEETAQTDSLTGILNRLTLEKRYATLYREMQVSGKEFCLMMIDIDHFKEVNDSHGHLVGDSVLKELANYLKSYFRKSDLIFRYGGEEFVVLLPDISLSHAIVSAQKLRALIAKEIFRSEYVAVSVTISIGLSMIGKDDDTLNSIIAKADNALYEAKSNGRDRVEVYHS